MKDIIIFCIGTIILMPCLALVCANITVFGLGVLYTLSVFFISLNDAPSKFWSKYWRISARLSDPNWWAYKFNNK